MDIKEIKKTLRKQMLQQRATFPNERKSDYDRWVCAQLEKIVVEGKSKVVHVYLPMDHEININSFIAYCLINEITIVSSKTLPKRKLQNLILNTIDDVEDGVYGTTYPANTKEYFGDYDLIVIPGLAFDANNYRLGYGGGYYDNFLINHPEAKKVGIFYAFQEVDEVPTEPHDLALDVIISNKELIK